MGFYLHNGKWLVDEDGGFATHEDCCCGDCDPCTDSYDQGITQNDATVTVSGTCSGGNCSPAAGTYTFSHESDDCGWFWTKGFFTLYVSAQAGGGFYAALGADGDMYDGPVMVTCDPNTNKLSVSGTLTGQDGGYIGEDCVGCSATVSV